MDERTLVPAALEALDPAEMTYQEWVDVGMALHAEGYPASAWDEWSRRDPRRHHPGECERKWASFGNSPTRLAGGTIVRMARDAGWSPARAPWDGPDEALEDWDSPIAFDPSWVEPAELPERPWDPAGEAIRYLEAVFDTEDVVGFVTEAFRDDDGRWKPGGRGSYTQTRAKLTEALRRTRDVGAAFGDAEPQAGAWVRFNPLTGAGVRNADVAEFRHALVESDELDQGRQLALIRELELPCSAIVDSGGKSVHAIVRVDAADYAEYRRRVDYLYGVCERHGLKVDQQNKNPSRLSRLPGFMRGGRRQRMIGGRCGKASWEEWVAWVEEAEDGLPDIEPFDSWDEVPDPPEPLIEGILNPGDKMMLAGPSKAGKSFALIELCAAVAEGGEWLGRRCRRGRVLYVNLELKRESRLRRIKAVYRAMGMPPEHVGDIHCLDLRGVNVPLDKLARSIIRRAASNRYSLVVIDPLYKVMGGDESDSEAVKRFCAQIDRLAEGMGCAVCYCHHYSKGDQAQKASIDRASGSGVFARDADSLLAMTEVELTDAARKAREDAAVGRACAAFLDSAMPDWRARVDEDAALAGGDRMVSECRRLLDPVHMTDAMLAAVKEARDASARETAWRIEGTFRDLPACKPIDAWFSYPAHEVDASGVLGDLALAGNDWRGRGRDRRKSTPRGRREERSKSLDEAYGMCDSGEGVTVADLAGYLGVTKKTVRNRIEEHGGFWVRNGTVGRKGR